jgi:NADPH:quinone reductase-like Zn-dependent oxidoreductase
MFRLERLEANNNKLEANEVAVKFLAAPINPADINLVSQSSI